MLIIHNCIYSFLQIIFVFLFFFSKNVITQAEAPPFNLSSEIVVNLQPTILDTISKTKEISGECSKSLMNLYGSSDLLYIKKLYTDSSHNKKDLGSFQHCMNSIYYSKGVSTESIMDNLKFVLFHIPKTTYCDDGPFLLGGCIAKGCTDEEYIAMLKQFGTTIKFADENCFSAIEAYDTDKSFVLTNQFFIGIIPLVLFLIITLFDFFPKIPRFMFRCCFKKKKKNYTTLLNDTSINKKSEGESTLLDSTYQDTKLSLSFLKSAKYYDINSLARLKRCFKLKSNFAEIMSSDISLHESKTNNESGISFTKGLRGIFLILYIIGMTFQSLYQSPMRDLTDQNFSETSLSFLYFVSKYSSNMLLGISGFAFCYKLLCYLDSEVEKIELKEEDFINNDNSPSQESNDIMAASKSKHK